MSKNIAVITGASSGIGKQFVLQLDNEGLDEIWVISNDKDGLSKLQSECKTKIIPFAWDLVQEESFVAYRGLLDQEKPNIVWLCSCAGFGKFGRHDEICINQTQNMIDLNCKAYVKMTEFTIPYMSRGAKIIEIASIAAFQPIPYMMTYGATKAFTVSYTRALRQELKQKGISVTCVCPYWTKTGFFDVAKDTNAKDEVVSKYATMYDPAKVVARAIKHARKGKEMSIYGAKARAQARFVKLMPHRFVMWVWKKQQKLDKKYEKKKEGN